MKRLASFATEHQVVGIDSISMANVLMLLSHAPPRRYYAEHVSTNQVEERVFECKTCSRKFPSFQALGGHRASHKKPRLSDVDSQGRSQGKPKVHGCSICGLEFAIGQALGGHMRRHRATTKYDGFVEKKSNGKRVLSLDLNLPPTSDDETECMKLGLELGLGFGVDCFH